MAWNATTCSSGDLAPIDFKGHAYFYTSDVGPNLLVSFSNRHSNERFASPLLAKREPIPYSVVLRAALRYQPDVPLRVLVFSCFNL